MPCTGGNRGFLQCSSIILVCAGVFLLPGKKGVSVKILFCSYISPNSLLWGLLLKKKEVCTGLRAPAQLGVAWAWRGRGLGVRGLGVWLGRGVGMRGRGLGVGVAWAWRGRGLGVVWAWLGRGLGMHGVGVAWAWLGRGVG